MVGLAALAAVIYWLKSDNSSIGSETRVETVAIDQGDIERTVATSGAVRPLITVEVGSQLSGQVAEIHADFNSLVKKGQVIAVIDPQSFESRVLQNEADIEVANANVTVQKANIDRAKANLRKTRLEYERAEPLSIQGTLSLADYDIALSNFESAKADLVMAKAQLETSMATLKQRKASLESAQIDLERTRIRSPIDGVVIERAIDQGQTVAASLSSPTLFYIAQDLTEIQIEANVDEADIGNVKAGNEATFSVDAFPDEEFSGSVEQVRLVPNELNNVVTYTVIISARNAELKLLPGMTAIVEIVTGKSDNVLRVTNEAIRFKPAPGSKLASLSPQTGERGPRRPGGLADINQITASLNLDAGQASAIKEQVEALMTELRGQFQGGGMSGDNDRIAMREQLQQRRAQLRTQVAAVFERHLSAEQFQQYQQLQRQAAETRPGQLWIRSESGDIQPVSVRLGISDDLYTQIFSRDLQVGDMAVTRVREVKN